MLTTLHGGWHPGRAGHDNPQHMFIATQDRALRAALGRVPGTALIFASVNGLHLEAPSAEQVAGARAAVAGHMAVKPEERRVPFPRISAPELS